MLRASERETLTRFKYEIQYIFEKLPLPLLLPVEGVVNVIPMGINQTNVQSCIRTQLPPPPAELPLSGWKKHLEI